MKHGVSTKHVKKLWLLFCAVLLVLLSASVVTAKKAPPPPPPRSNIPDPDRQHPTEDEGWERPAPAREDLPSFTPPADESGFLFPSIYLVINEFDEWDDNIEFYNKSGGSFDLTGWTLTIYDYTDSVDVIYEFPSGFVLGSGAYVVLHEFGLPSNNTSTDLYSGYNFWLVQESGALALVDEWGYGMDFVRWGSNLTSPPIFTGWVGTNLIMPMNGLSLGRDSASTDTDYADDWMVQENTWGAVNDDSQCYELDVYEIGEGALPVLSPTQSSGCSTGYFHPGEEITLISDPLPGWEVGQWGEYPVKEYLGNDPTLTITMNTERVFVRVNYLESDPAPGTVLLMGLWDPYGKTLEDLGIPYNQIDSNWFAPDFDVLNRYDMVIYNAYWDPGHFVYNMSTSNFATYLEEGNCMWIETDWYASPGWEDPDVLASHFGVWGWATGGDTTEIKGKGSLFNGFGPYPYVGPYYFEGIYPSPEAEIAFKGDDGEVFGVSKINQGNLQDYITAYVTFEMWGLDPADRMEIMGRMADQCLPPANDDFDYAYVIPSSSYSNTQDGLQIRQSTVAGDDPGLWYGTQRPYSVWYSFTPTETEDLTITTFGSTYDTVLGVWTGTRGSLSLVVENDDTGSLQSKVEFTANAGTTYYIEIAGFWFGTFGKLVLNVSGDLLFMADFETGDLSQWTRFNDGGGWLYACPQAAMNGVWGACVERGDNDKRKQLIDETPVSQTFFNARFNFDINSLSMGSGERFRFVQTKMGAERPYYIVLKYDGHYSIQLSTLLDNGTWAKTGWHQLTDAPHTIEIGWQASSGPGANDGYAELFMDGSLKEALVGLDTDTIFIESFRMGFTSRLSGKSISGIFYIDDVATSNSGYIGLP